MGGMRQTNHLKGLAAPLFVTCFSGCSATSSDGRELVLAAQSVQSKE